jgi:hypothetical protein
VSETGGRGQLTPKEILRKVLDAGRAVETFRVVETDVDDKSGRRTQHTTERIQVGDDVYSKVTDTDVGPDQIETLWLHGRVYHRGSPADEWRLSHGTYVTLMEWKDERDGVDLKRSQYLGGAMCFLDFNSAAGVERLEDDVVGGRRLIHLRANFTQPLHPPDPESIRRELERVHPGKLPPLPDALFHAPDYASGTIDLWIGAEDFHLYRTEAVGASYLRDEKHSAFRRTAEFSDFNEPLELPGPLPDAD